MFNFLESLVKTTTAVTIGLPAAVIADVFTLGGSLVDEDKPYTVQAFSDIKGNIDNLTKPVKE